MGKKKWVKTLKIILLTVILLAAGAYFAAHRAFALLDRSIPPEPAVKPDRGAVFGYVFSAQKRLLPGMATLKGAQVVLAPGGYEAVADQNGVYYLSDLPPGTYSVTFRAGGFEEYTVEGVRLSGGQPVYLEGALFPEPKGEPKAALSLTTSMGFGKPPAEYAYNTTVYLDAGKSVNASRNGFRFEILGPDGKQVISPLDPPNPLVPVTSEMPKSPPYVFSFQPPAPGEYTVRLYLSNRLSDVESVAEVKVKAVNVPPEAMPSLYAGPLMPQKEGSAGLKVSSGLGVVPKGKPVYIRGYALDQNYPSPELYNPGGNHPDIYGKDNNHEQSVYSWRWRLEKVTGQSAEDVSALLQKVDEKGQHVMFVPEEPGLYRAWLSACDNDKAGALWSEEQAVEIRVLDEPAYVDDSSCLSCHDVEYGNTVHGAGQGAGCQDCHGPGSAHLAAKNNKQKRETIDISYEAGLCGQCHVQYNEWEKSMHADGYAYGYYEIARPLLLNCTKCHYPEGFARAAAVSAQTGKPFGEVEFKKPLFPTGPVFFDFSMLPAADGKGVSCAACHDPHKKVSSENPYALRYESGDELCGSCHQEKWHNLVLKGTAGEAGSAFEYESAASFSNPHYTKASCVLCHMDKGQAATDDKGIREVGGHTMRMRAKGDAAALGGFGDSPVPGEAVRTGDVEGNILNLGPCRQCHGEINTFNINNVQEENLKLWLEVGELLRERNQGILPGYKPGDKCATCHRGGTLPFFDDPELELEHAYRNYKLVGRDKSFGVHNPGYIRQLLLDTLKQLTGDKRQ